MSEEKTFCDSCGLYSPPGELCHSCGEPLLNLPENQVGFAPSKWGRLSIRLTGEDSKDSAETLIQIWRFLETKTEQSLLPSQLDKIRAEADCIELYGSEFSAEALLNQMGDAVTVDFQELAREDLPTIITKWSR